MKYAFGIRICLLSSILVVFGLSAADASTLDQIFVGDGGSGGGFANDVVLRGQTFTVGLGGQLERIEVQLLAFGGSNSAELFLYPVLGSGLPDLGTLLASTSVSGIPDGEGFVEFDVTSGNVLVNPTDELGFLINQTGGALNIRGTSPVFEGYAGGAPIQSFDGGSTASTHDGDWHFKTYVKIPEPSSYAALTSLGLVGLCMAYRKRKPAKK